MGILSSAGAKKGAETEAAALKSLAPAYGTLTEKQYGAISPYMKAGQGALTAQMQMLANPINSQVALSEYYASPEYAMQQDQAAYSAMAGAEAAGTMGNTATSNVLASSATQLGQTYLKSLNTARGQQIDTLGDISQQGLSATKTMGGWASNNLSDATDLMAGAAQLEGQAAAAPYYGMQRSLFQMPYYLGMGKGKGK